MLKERSEVRKNEDDLLDTNALIESRPKSDMQPNVLDYIDALKKVAEQFDENTIQPTKNMNRDIMKRPGNFNYTDKAKRVDNTRDRECFTLLQPPPAPSAQSKTTKKHGGGNISSDKIWDKMFEALLVYGDKHNGSYDVPIHYVQTAGDDTELKLGLWLNAQKEKYLINTLDLDRLRRLQDLADKGGLDWNASTELGNDHWIHMYETLLEYSNLHEGNCNVPPNIMFKRSDGQNMHLGVWLQSQRLYRKCNKLHEDQLLRLQALVDEGRLSWEISLPTISPRPIETDEERKERVLKAVNDYKKRHSNRVVSAKRLSAIIESTVLAYVSSASGGDKSQLALNPL